MANPKASEQKSGGCGILSCLWWLVSLTTKVSILVAMVALLVTVHQMRNSNLENVLLLQRAQVDMSVAIQQKEAATLAHTKANSHLNQLQTDLAKVRSELQQLQQTASAQRLDVQKEADRHAQEAKSAKQENLVLIQKLNDAEAANRKQQVDGSQQTQEVLQALQNEKQSLEQSLASVQSTAEQRAAELKAAIERQQQLEQELQQLGSKATHEAHINEQLHAKEKAQDRKINELSETIKKLEEAAKEYDLLKEQLALVQDPNTAAVEAEEAQALLRVRISELEEELKEKKSADEKLTRAILDNQDLQINFGKLQRKYKEVAIKLAVRQKEEPVSLLELEYENLKTQKWHITKQKDDEIEALQRDIAELRHVAGGEGSGGECVEKLAEVQARAREELQEEKSQYLLAMTGGQEIIKMVQKQLLERVDEAEMLKKDLRNMKTKWIESDLQAQEALKEALKKQDDLTQQLMEVKPMLEQLQQKEPLIKYELEQEKKVKEQLTQQLEQLQKAAHQIKQELEQSKQGEAEMKHKLNQAEEAEQPVKQALEQERQEKQQLTQQLNQLKQAEQQIKQELEHSKHGEVEMKHKLDQAEEAARRIMQELKEERQEKQQSMQQLEQLQQAEQQIKQELEQLKQGESKIKHNLDQAEEAVQRMKQNLEQSQKDDENMNQKFNQNQQEEQKLKLQLQQIEQQLKEQMEQAHKKEEQLASLQEATHRCEAEQGASHAKAEDFEALLQQTTQQQQRVSELETQVAAIVTSYEELLATSLEKEKKLEASLARTREDWITANQWGAEMETKALDKEKQLTEVAAKLAEVEKNIEKEESESEEIPTYKISEEVIESAKAMSKEKLLEEMKFVGQEINRMHVKWTAELEKHKQKYKKAKTHWIEADHQLEMANKQLQQKNNLIQELENKIKLEENERL